jgi:hypothetical protein
MDWLLEVTRLAQTKLIVATDAHALWHQDTSVVAVPVHPTQHPKSLLGSIQQTVQTLTLATSLVA